MKRYSSQQRRRRGVIAVLAAVLMVIMLAMVAFAVDIGYLGLARTQLQAAADSAALAAAASSNLPRAEMENVAKGFAGANTVAGRPVQLDSGDIQYGNWDTGSRTFTPSTTASNAIRVTVRTSEDTGGQTALFFGKLFGTAGITQKASAVATINPRDIAFVIDLSGSMNDDTDPSYSSSTQTLLQNIYDDFGFGTYSNSTAYPVQQHAGQPWVSNNTSWVNNLTKSGGKLRQSSIPARYRVLSSDSTSTKTWKAYAWVMEVQLAGLVSYSGMTPAMPNVIPVPNASNPASYNYWQEYIDPSGTPQGYRARLGFRSYLEMMMGLARDGTAPTSGGSHTPLSLDSELCACPMHTETVGGQSFSFPPREMPTHAARRAMIAAIQVVRDRNLSITDVNQKDWVSIIAFDSIDTETIKWSLENKDNYSGAMDKCRLLQANGWTGTEAGLDLAYDHIKPESEGGAGREVANKVVVLLTDGMPNQKRSSVTTTMINSYINDNPSVWTNPETGQEINNWVTGGDYIYQKNAALMHTSAMRGDNWYVYAAGIGGGCDYDFMDRVARMGLTANPDGQSPRGSGDASIYEAVLRQIFEDIITNPKLRLVQ